jgi:putative peptidoglycan lipid II flippase
VLAPGFFARGDMATPVKIGVSAVVLNLAMNVAFMVPLQHIGPALATSLAALFNVVGLSVALARRGLLRLDPQLRRRSVRMVLACGAMGLALALAQQWLFAVPPHGWARIGALALLVGVGLAVYGAAAAALGASDVRALGRLLPARGRRRGVG